MRLQIDWASLIVRSKFTVFALVYFVFVCNFPSTSPRGTYIWRGDLTEGFCVTGLGGGLIFGGTYTWRGLFSEFYGSVLIEQGILVLPHSRTPTVDVRISLANRTTGELREQFFFSQIFSGPGILQSSRFFRTRLAVYSGFEPTTSRSAVRYATNSANHSQNPAPLTTALVFGLRAGTIMQNHPEILV